MHTPELGLLQLVDFKRQETIKADIDLCFIDLFDSISGARENARELQKTVTRALEGTRCDLSDERRRI